VIRDHRFYEMQSALSATGHLTASELEELEQHVSQCGSCRSCLVDMATVSREIFLAQVWTRNRETPKGMQQRFIERAVAAGIPLKVERSAAFDFRFARVAAITAVLTILITVAWKVASTPPVERWSRQVPSQMDARPEATSQRTPHPFDGRVVQTRNARRSKRRPAVPGRAVLKPFPVVSRGDLSHPYLALNRPLFAKEYAAGLFRRKWDGKPEERSFHLDLTLASLSRSDSPLNTSASSPVPNLKFTAPVFHIDPSRIW
jgi:hypothetical protein